MESLTRCYRYALLPVPSQRAVIDEFPWSNLRGPIEASKRRSVLDGYCPGLPFPRSYVRGPIAQSRNAVGKIGAEKRTRLSMIAARKERHGTVEVADPDLGGAGVEVEGTFFVDLGWGVRWGKDFDTDFGCASEKDRILAYLGALVSEPRNVGCLDSIGGRNGAFGERRAVGEQALEESGDSGLAAGVTSSGRWTHDDMSVPIGLDAVGEPGELRVSQDLGPTSQVKPGLRLEIGELNGDRHRQRYARNGKRR